MKVTVWCSSQELTLVPAIVTWQKGVCTPHVDRVCLAGPCSPTWKGRFRDVTSTLTQLVISTRFLLDIIIGHWTNINVLVIYGCESWTIRKAERQRIDAFELWCWRRLLRVPWTARRSNQSILKENSPEYSLEGLMLKLKLLWPTWCEELIHLKRPWCEKDWRQEEEGTTEDEMVGWCHWLNGHEFD